MTIRLTTIFTKKTSKRYSSALIIIALVVGLQSSTASAVDLLFYSSNGINKYNPDDQGSKCSSTAVPSPVVAGDNNEERTWNYMKAQGFTDQQVAGMIGNWQIEAPGLNPRTNQEGGGPGRGIAQWTVTERWATLLNWKGDRSEFDLITQLDFVMYELNGTEGAALTALKSTTTIRDATTSFMEKYERPGEPHLDRRITAANTAFGRYSSEAGTPLPPQQTTTSQTSVVSDPCSESASGAGGTVVQVAQAELAKNVVEIPAGCDAGNKSIKGDCGPEVNKYTDGTLEYWCADFTSWVFKEAGTPFTGGSSGGWRIAAVSGLEEWFAANGTFTPNGPNADPQPGDIYTLEVSHVGIVEKVEGTTLHTISGNTGVDSSNNGSGVGRSIYNNFRSDKSITGFGSLRK